MGSFGFGSGSGGRLSVRDRLADFVDRFGRGDQRSARSKSGEQAAAKSYRDKQRAASPKQRQADGGERNERRKKTAGEKRLQETLLGNKLRATEQTLTPASLTGAVGPGTSVAPTDSSTVASAVVDEIKQEGALARIKPKLVEGGAAVDLGDGEVAVLPKGQKSKLVEKRDGEKVLLLDEDLDQEELEEEVEKSAKFTIKKKYFQILYTFAASYGEYLSVSRAMADRDQYRIVGPNCEVVRD